MSSLVCDASVLFKLLVAEPDSADAFALMANHQIVVPEFTFLEIGNALRSRVRSERAGPQEVLSLFAELDDFAFDIRPTRPHVARALAIANAIEHPIYDCLYLALAEHLDIALISADRRFLDAVRRAGFSSAEIKLLADFA